MEQANIMGRSRAQREHGFTLGHNVALSGLDASLQQSIDPLNSLQNEALNQQL